MPMDVGLNWNPDQNGQNNSSSNVKAEGAVNAPKANTEDKPKKVAKKKE